METVLQKPLVPIKRDTFSSQTVRHLRQLEAYLESPRVRKDFWDSLGLEIRKSPVRSSDMKLLHECPRKYMYKNRLGLVPNRYEAALDIGTELHSFVGPLYKGMLLENLGKHTAATVAEIYGRIEKTADKTGMLPNGKTLGEQMLAVEKDMQMAAALAAVFAKYLPPEQLFETYEIVSVEETYAITVEGLDEPLIIQPDVLLRNKKTGAYWIVDHKTTSVDPKVRAAILPLELQPRFYMFVLSSWFKADGKEVKMGGYIHNILRKPTIRQKQNETLAQYIDRVHEWFKDENAKDPNSPPILQSIVSQKGPLLNEEMLVRIYSAGRAGAAALDLSRFHKEEGSCFGKFGNTPCAYMELCQNEGDVKKWPKYIKDNFRQEWRDLKGK